MKNYILGLTALLFLAVGCKDNKKETPQTVAVKELSILDKVANAHGFENWKTVSSIKYTFNVDRDSSHFERTWVWEPKTNNVILTTKEDTVRYNRMSMDSTIIKTDGGFINDKFWLLGPYQLIWDQHNFTYEHETSSVAPISKEKMQKLTIVYGSEGGYTPGDAYDFYFEKDYKIKEWVFRKGNVKEPIMITSWEDYTNVNGMYIAQMHKMPESNFKLYFTGIEVR